MPATSREHFGMPHISSHPDFRTKRRANKAKDSKPLVSLDDIEKRIRGIVEGRVGSSGTRYRREHEIFQAVFPRAISKDDIGLDVFMTSLDSLGFNLGKEDAHEMFSRYDSGGNGATLDFGKFRKKVLNEQTFKDPDSATQRSTSRSQSAMGMQRGRSTPGHRSRPGSGLPWDRTSEDYGWNKASRSHTRPHTATSVSSAGGKRRATLGKKSTYVTDSRVPPTIGRPASSLGSARRDLHSYETTYERFHENIVSAPPPSGYESLKRASTKDSRVWCTAYGVPPPTKEKPVFGEVSAPRAKTWITSPMEKRPPLIDHVDKKSRHIVDMYQSKYMLDTSNVTSCTAPRATNSRTSQSCTAMAVMGVFPANDVAMTDLVKDVSSL